VLVEQSQRIVARADRCRHRPAAGAASRARPPPRSAAPCHRAGAEAHLADGPVARKYQPGRGDRYQRPMSEGSPGAVRSRHAPSPATLEWRERAAHPPAAKTHRPAWETRHERAAQGPHLRPRGDVCRAGRLHHAALDEEVLASRAAGREPHPATRA